jgi:hypothetical protein
MTLCSFLRRVGRQSQKIDALERERGTAHEVGCNCLVGRQGRWLCLLECLVVLVLLVPSC